MHLIKWLHYSPVHFLEGARTLEGRELMGAGGGSNALILLILDFIDNNRLLSTSQTSGSTHSDLRLFVCPIITQSSQP